MRTSNASFAIFALASLAATVVLPRVAAAQTSDPNAQPNYGYPYSAPTYQPGQYPSPTYDPPPPSVYTPPPAYDAPPPPAYTPPPPRYVYRTQGPYARRFIRGYLGVGGMGTFVLKQDGGVEKFEHGGGFSIFGGLDFGRIVGVEVSYTGSYHNPDTTLGCGAGYSEYGNYCDVNYLTLDLLTLSGRLRLPLRSRFQPYVQGGVAIAWSGRQGYPADATGFGFEVGGGVDIWLGNFFTFGPRVLYRGVQMSDYGTITGADTFLNLITAEANMAVRF